MLALKQRLKEIDPERFQELCLHVLRARFPGVQIKQVGGRAGDEGVDIFEGQLEGKPCIWQCKYFPNGVGKSQQQQITRSLRRVLERLKPKRWVLCLPIDPGIRAHRWFQKLQTRYRGKVLIELFPGSEIRNVLIHNRPILDTFFPDAIMNVQSVKAELADLGKLSSKELETITADSADEYLQRLRDKDPRFDFRVSVPPVHRPQTLSELQAKEPVEGLVLSVSDERKTVDVLARDIEALALDPPKFRVEVTAAAAQKFLHAVRTGEELEFGPDEICGVYSSLESLVPRGIRPTKLVMGPTAEVRRQRFHFRVTFSQGQDSVVYDLVEFRINRRGTEEFELISVDSDSPLQLTVLARRGGTGRLNIAYGWDGKEVRAVQKAITALNLIGKRAKVELFDLKQGRTFFQAGLLAGKSSPVRKAFEEVVGKIAEVAEAFCVNIRLTTDFPERDEKTLNFLLEVVRKGKISLRAGKFSVNLVKDEKHIQDFLGWSKCEKAVYTTPSTYSPAPRLFGVEIDTGPCAYYSSRARLLNSENTVEAYISAKEGESVPIQIQALEPIELTFQRFLKR